MTNKAFEMMAAEATTAMKAYNKVYPFEQVMDNASEEKQEKMLAAGMKAAKKAIRKMDAEVKGIIENLGELRYGMVNTEVVLMQNGFGWQRLIREMEAAAEEAQSNAMRLQTEASYEKCAKAIYAVKSVAYNMVPVEAQLRKMGLWKEIAE